MTDSPQNRGFHAMDPEKHRAIASMGGKAVPNGKRNFSQNREAAVQAGRKGGASLPPEKRSYSQDRELAAASGRKGGKASAIAKKAAREGLGRDGLPSSTEAKC